MELNNLDLEKLLSPISADRPAGEPLIHDPLYDSIREARRHDDPSLEQGVWKTDLKQADWGAVENLCTEALETRSKDLVIGYWLLESLMQLHGFRGVADGLQILHGICQNFWADVYPAAKGDDLEGRLAPLRLINEKLSVGLKLVPLTKPVSYDLRRYHWADWERAQRMEAAAGHDKAKGDDEGVTQAAFSNSVTLTPDDEFKSHQKHLRAALDCCSDFGRFLDKRCGKQSPSLEKFKSTLRGMLTFTEDVLTERRRGADLPGTGPGETSAAPPARASPRVRSRAEAYRMLAEAADYLMRAEPHSPVPYLVRRAVGWGNMSLDKLLAEVVRNDAERSEICRLLDITKGS